MIGLWNVNWLNQNSQRAYPFTDECDKVTELSPDLRIPDDFLLALRLAVNAGHSLRVDKLFLSSIVVSEVGCTISIGYNGDGRAKPVAVGYVAKEDGIVNCRLTGVGDFADTVGYAAFGGWSSLFRDWVGYYTFSPSSSYLDPDCTVPMLRSVSSISVESGTGNSEKFYGDIVIDAGSNMRVSTHVTNGVTHITLSAIDASGFTADCSCDMKEDTPCIRRISGVAPSSNGRLIMEGEGCVSIQSSGNKLIINDTCADPECGCEQLERMASTVREMEDSVQTLNNRVSDLYGTVMSTNLTITNSEIPQSCGSASGSPADIVAKLKEQLEDDEEPEE